MLGVPLLMCRFVMEYHGAGLLPGVFQAPQI